MSVQGETVHKKIVLVGNPNVGKSVIFRLLTGSYVLVSNFPGTTVEISRGKMQVGTITYEVVDTPGINSLLAQSEDERVTCGILLRERPDIIIQVADAKNLRRTLLVTSQLVEFGIPMVLVLNMMDEAEERGIEINIKGLSELFSMPLVETVAIYSRGRKQLMAALQNLGRPRSKWTERLPVSLNGHESHTSLPSALAIEWLAQNDPSFTSEIKLSYGDAAITHLAAIQDLYRKDKGRSLAREIAEIRDGFIDEAVAAFRTRRQSRYLAEAPNAVPRFWLGCLLAGLLLFVWNEFGGIWKIPTPFSVCLRILTEALARRIDPQTGWHFWRSVLLGPNAQGSAQFGLVPAVVHFLLIIAPVIVPFGVLLTRNRGFAYEFGILTRKAATGIPILIGVLLLVFEFVGFTGAQTLVGLVEQVLFGQYLVPFLQRLLPAGFFAELIVGKYGIVSMGLSYAIGIVLPVVGTFFITFSLLEDSGYLPRLSILSDRVMRVMGLNGKATLPMILGLGCCTMATMTTRILNSKKERIIATLLLALGIPCSAQLGVILGIAAGFSPKAVLIVLGVVLSQLILVGFLSSQLIKGRRSEFIFEIPPIRAPQLRNVALKTGHRIVWYLKEAVPLFLYGTLALFTLDKLQVSGRSLLDWIETGLAPLLSGVLALPRQAAAVFVLGFLRRDYGAAGLFEMVKHGMLSAQQTVVSLIVITLFVPCLASFLVITKEHGIKKALSITAFITVFALGIGASVSWILRTFAIQF
jgi:ferrous iron transport protein B